VNVLQLAPSVQNVRITVVSVDASKGLWEGHVTDVNLDFIISLKMAVHVSKYTFWPQLKLQATKLNLVKSNFKVKAERCIKPEICST
jgi:hypothetical protein